MSEVRPGSDSRESIVRVIVRWFCAVQFMIYGFAKVNGSQFTVLDSQLATPLEDVSAFWLVWYFFGYSGLYKGVIALIEIGGGVLLAFRRTALLGTLVLLAAIVNIVLIDVGFGVAQAGLPMAIVLMCGLLYLLIPHVRQLLAALFIDHESTRAARVATLGGVVLAGVLAFSFTYWVANFNNRLPTEIDGTWEVLGEQTENISHVFFERNRAFQVVFMDEDGALRNHHFEIDGGNEQVAVEMRRHGNFIEHVPILLLLMAIVEINGAQPVFLHVVGVALVLFRIAHPLGLHYGRAQTPLRLVGAVGISLVTIALGAVALWQGAQTLLEAPTI